MACLAERTESIFHTFFMFKDVLCPLQFFSQLDNILYQKNRTELLMHLWWWVLVVKRATKIHTHIPRTLFQVLYFLSQRGRTDHRTHPGQGPLADESQPEKQSSDPHTPLTAGTITVVCDTHSKKEMLRKSGSTQKQNSAKKHFGSFYAMPWYPLQCSAHQGYMSVCKIFPCLDCCTNWIQNPDGGMNV